MEEDKPGDWDIVTTYKRVLNSEEGVKMLDHLKEVCRYSDPIFDYDISPHKMMAMHYMTRIINYMEAMRDRDTIQQPEEIIDPLGIINEQ